MTAKRGRWRLGGGRDISVKKNEGDHHLSCVLFINPIQNFYYEETVSANSDF